MPVLATIQRIQGEDARQFAYRMIGLSILELLLRPGEKLSEAELAHSLHMSRTPVHDVLSRLARENLVDLIPQRGAFVVRIDPVRVEQAAWIQTQAGASMLDTLYAERVPAHAFAVLKENLARQQLCIATEDYTQAMRHVVAFHHSLYELANLSLVWHSMQCASADLHRVFQLCAPQPAHCESTFFECRCILDALIARDSAAACRALCHQFQRINDMLPSLLCAHPEFFIQPAD
ncbi:MAG: GntR family transcriptional regulator [Ruthenibacterium sp.]